MRVLVTGAAGFIGSTTVQHLVAKGHSVVGLDNLYTGKRLVPGGTYIVGNCGDLETLKQIPEIDACIHFAGSIAVSDSFMVPEQYYQNNVAETLTLVNYLMGVGVNKFVFSSSAAIYASSNEPIAETYIKLPSSPYGLSKLMVEQALSSISSHTSLKYAALRYFNAAGCLGEFAEAHKPETHIIPRAFEAAVNNETFRIFGSNYNTPDGTCVRDYVHVNDLARAHVLALEALDTQKSIEVNLGSGVGISNFQIMGKVKEVTGINFRVEFGNRRKGDPDSLVADITKAKDLLGWVPMESDLTTIVTDAWVGYQHDH